MTFKNNNLRLDIICVSLFFAVAFFVQCANPAAPQGGPRDTIAPKILSITPPLLSTNFKEKKVVIIFNEYIQVKDVQKEVLISPEMKRRPRFTVKGKSLIIEFEEQLDSATTYKIDFGNSIQDNNEGNPLVNFAYVFSTGNSIDSLAMSGQVIDAFTGDSILNALILLFDAKKDSLPLDSVLYKSLPNSIARTDSMGVFIATNLKPIDYRVYAIKEDPTTGKYDRGADKIAFSDVQLNPSKLPPFNVWFNPIRLRIEASPQMEYRLFSEPAPLRRQNLAKSVRSDKHTVVLQFAEKNPVIYEFTLDSIDMSKVVTTRTKHNDTITLYIPADLTIPDSVKGKITYASTTGDSIPKDTIVTKQFVLGYREIEKKRRKKDDEKEPNPFKVGTESQQLLNPYQDIIFKFGYPLRSIDSSRITLTHIIEHKAKEERGARGARSSEAPKKEVKKPEAQRENVKFSIFQDSIDILKWHLKSNWVEAGKYELLIPDSVFIDILNLKNDTIKSSFSIMDREKYGTVTVQLLNRDSSYNYILSFINGKKHEYTIPLINNNDVLFEFIKSGKYKINVVEDRNRNGKWDDGDLIQRIQPEYSKIYRDESGNSIFEVKENWELKDIKIDLQKLFKKEQHSNEK